MSQASSSRRFAQLPYLDPADDDNGKYRKAVPIGWWMKKDMAGYERMLRDADVDNLIVSETPVTAEMLRIIGNLQRII